MVAIDKYVEEEGDEAHKKSSVRAAKKNPKNTETTTDFVRWSFALVIFVDKKIHFPGMGGGMYKERERMRGVPVGRKVQEGRWKRMGANGFNQSFQSIVSGIPLYALAVII